jgi:hypothetical protein
MKTRINEYWKELKMTQGELAGKVDEPDRPSSLKNRAFKTSPLFWPLK